MEQGSRIISSLTPAVLPSRALALISRDRRLSECVCALHSWNFGLAVSYLLRPVSQKDAGTVHGGRGPWPVVDQNSESRYEVEPD